MCIEREREGEREREILYGYVLIDLFVYSTTYAVDYIATSPADGQIYKNNVWSNNHRVSSINVFQNTVMYFYS